MQPHRYQYDLDKQRANEIAQQVHIAKAGNNEQASSHVPIYLLVLWYSIQTVVQLVISGFLRYKS